MCVHLGDHAIICKSISILSHNSIYFFSSKVTGPEPNYGNIISGYNIFNSGRPFRLKYNNAVLPELVIAYETWGELNADKSNAVVIHAGLSASSHAKSHEVSMACNIQ